MNSFIFAGLGTCNSCGRRRIVVRPRAGLALCDRCTVVRPRRIDDHRMNRLYITNAKSGHTVYT